MKIHPYADKFPLRTEEGLQQLVSEIQKDGLLHPIITWKGMIIDGRNRFRACEIAGVAPRFEARDFSSDDRVVDFIIETNIDRLHMNPGQRAMLGEVLRPRLEAETQAKIRAAASVGGKIGGRGRPNSPAPNSEQGYSKADRKRDADVNVQIGKIVGVGHNTCGQAKKVNEGSKELAAKVISGEMTLNAALKELRGGATKKEKKVDPKTLSQKAQEKLEAAIRQEKRRLQAEHEAMVLADARRRIEETILPHYNRERKLYQAVLKSHNGVIPRAMYRKILGWLHPDRVVDPGQKEAIAEVFRYFKEREALLCKEKEANEHLPRTYDDLTRMAEEARRRTNGR